MPMRQPRPGGVPRKKSVPVHRAQTADAEAAMEAVEPIKVQNWRQYLECQRIAHLHAKGRNNGTTFHAFEALSLLGAKFMQEVDDAREADGLAPIVDYGVEAPSKFVKVPAWVALTIMQGWLRATKCDVAPDGTEKPPYSVVEAFHLGSAARSRSVIERHRVRSRDVELALMAAALFARAKASGEALSDQDAFAAVAAEGKVSASTVRLAWLKHRDKACDVVDRSGLAFSDVTQPLKAK